MTVARTPLYFGPAERSLFGWIHRDEDAPARGLAAVICPPFGHESINGHRTLRHLADALARAGIVALRFDYDGAGDSAGTDADPARVEAWKKSIAEAVSALRELAPGRPVALVGLRLGATLGAAVAPGLQIDAAVLWAPVTRGRAYVRELKALHGTSTAALHREGDDILEPCGFLVTDETARDLDALELPAEPPARRILLVEGDAAVRGPRWEADRIAGAPLAEMFAPPHDAVVPDETIARIVHWLAASHSPREEPARIPAPPGRSTLDLGTVRETLLPLGGIFAIATEPVHASPAGPVIVLSNAGAAHHAGPNRLYVLLARALAAAGFRCVRFDLPGLGDSFVEDAALENRAYPHDVTVTINDVLSALRGRGLGDSFVLLGLCSGAHASYHSALALHDAPIAEAVLINPLTFRYEDGMPLDADVLRRFSDWNWYLRSSRRPDRWLKLLRGRANVGRIVRAIRSRVEAASSSLRWRLHGERRAVPRPGDVGHELETIVRSGRTVTFVFARFSPGHDLLMTKAGSRLRRLRRRKQVHLWQIDGANHTFEPSAARTELISSLVEHFRRRYAKAQRISSRPRPDAAG
jgi:alpha-beta hydrolase superfamily lysophospholipase